MPNKTILYVVNSPSYFLAHHLPIAVSAKKKGMDVHVASRQESACAEIGARGFFFHPIPFSGREINPFAEIKTILALRKLYRSLKPDICHHITIKPMIYGSIAARYAQPLHVVNSVTGLGYVFVPEGGLKKRLLKWLVVRMFRFAFALPSMQVRFENPDDQKDLISLNIIPKGKGVVIKGVGIDLKTFIPTPEPGGTPIVMFASRFLWYKGIREFVEAADILKKEGVSTRFVLVGTNDPDNPSSVPMSQIREWVASSKIEWWGHQKNMPQILSQAAVVCLPSYYREGIPRILIEATALARPIVTTDMPGCRLIASNQNGLIVSPKDSRGLANAIRLLVENRDFRNEMGRKGRELVEQDFTEEHVVRQTMEIYRQFEGTPHEPQLMVA